MPGRQKRLLFSLCGLLGFVCALTAAVAAGLPAWLSGTVLCRTGAELVNATGPELDKFLGELSFGLFHGVRVKQCGLGGRATRFSCEFPVSLRVHTGGAGHRAARRQPRGLCRRHGHSLFTGLTREPLAPVTSTHWSAPSPQEQSQDAAFCHSRQEQRRSGRACVHVRVCVRDRSYPPPPPGPPEPTSLCWFWLFPVFPELLAVVPAGLHVSVIFFCAVVVLFSSVATGFFLLNAFGRPYETLQGPVGLYLWTCVSGGPVCV